jgi:hypothetical protein
MIHESSVHVTLLLTPTFLQQSGCFSTSATRIYSSAMSIQDAYQESSARLSQQLSHRPGGESSSSVHVDSFAMTTMAKRVTTSPSKPQTVTPEMRARVTTSDSSTLAASLEHHTTEQDNDQPQSPSATATRQNQSQSQPQSQSAATTQSKPHSVLEWLHLNWITIFFGFSSLLLAIVFGLYGIYSWQLSQKSYDQDMRSLELSLLSFCTDHKVESFLPHPLPFSTLQ